MIPYGRQSVSEADIAAVTEVLHSDWLTTGPRVEAFEQALAECAGAACGVAVNSGTAALHCAAHAAGVGPGDEVLVPALTFAASANCVAFQGGTPVFCDVDPQTLLLDPDDAERKITPQTKAIVAVDFGGQPCDYDRLRAIAHKHELILIADACHALGATYKGRPAGTLADFTAFSFHPVKHITTGEGGMIVTDDAALAECMRRFRNHGISSDFRQREERGSWFYEMVDLGYNYRITDLQCALGISQLKRLPAFLDRRRRIAARYDRLFAAEKRVTPLAVRPDVHHAYHLYVVRIDFNGLRTDRPTLFKELRKAGIGANVHYIPVHYHPFYRRRYQTRPGMCPVAEAAYEEILSLPMFPGLSDAEVDHVAEVLGRLLGGENPQRH